ncbi:hypothetical protein HPB50_004943 [Hyalomma asiaticum]|uniref:Uncharacterized protein n=1 Tax=Hyalomma asiaticum TaxID=266040 RepID=A0ACB7T5H7_HYAAI|nr:hypothetical protein HPB50_004943 [Hyalomma asiaticum]
MSTNGPSAFVSTVAPTSPSSAPALCLMTSQRTPGEIEVLDRSIRPTRAATLHISLGNTNVLLEDVVVTELPNGIDVILGSDWRRTANVDVTFHTTNDVTILPVEPAEGTSTHEATPTKRGTARRTGEALIASFCRQGNKHAPEEDGFIRLNTRCPAPDEDFIRSVEYATEKMTTDATEADRDRLRAILHKHYQAFTSKADTLGMCPHTEHSIELRDDIPVSSRPVREISRLPHAPGKINKKVVNVEQLRRYKERQLDMAEQSPSDDTCA